MYGRFDIHHIYLYCTPLVKALDTTKTNETATICDISFDRTYQNIYIQSAKLLGKP
jgi:hypothetical protein